MSNRDTFRCFAEKLLKSAENERTQLEQRCFRLAALGCTIDYDTVWEQARPNWKQKEQESILAYFISVGNENAKQQGQSPNTSHGSSENLLESKEITNIESAINSSAISLNVNLNHSVVKDNGPESNSGQVGSSVTIPFKDRDISASSFAIDDESQLSLNESDCSSQESYGGKNNVSSDSSGCESVPPPLDNDDIDEVALALATLDDDVVAEVAPPPLEDCDIFEAVPLTPTGDELAEVVPPPLDDDDVAEVAPPPLEDSDIFEAAPLTPTGDELAEVALPALDDDDCIAEAPPPPLDDEDIIEAAPPPPPRDDDITEIVPPPPPPAGDDDVVESVRRTHSPTLDDELFFSDSDSAKEPMLHDNVIQFSPATSIPSKSKKDFAIIENEHASTDENLVDLSEELSSLGSISDNELYAASEDNVNPFDLFDVNDLDISSDEEAA